MGSESRLRRGNNCPGGEAKSAFIWDRQFKKFCHEVLVLIPKFLHSDNIKILYIPSQLIKESRKDQLSTLDVIH